MDSQTSPIGKETRKKAHESKIELEQELIIESLRQQSSTNYLYRCIPPSEGACPRPTTSNEKGHSTLWPPQEQIQTNSGYRREVKHDSSFMFGGSMNREYNEIGSDASLVVSN
jgi:hypothetical protein